MEEIYLAEDQSTKGKATYTLKYKLLENCPVLIVLILNFIKDERDIQSFIVHLLRRI